MENYIPLYPYCCSNGILLIFKPLKGTLFETYYLSFGILPPHLFEFGTYVNYVKSPTSYPLHYYSTF